MDYRDNAVTDSLRPEGCSLTPVVESSLEGRDNAHLKKTRNRLECDKSTRLILDHWEVAQKMAWSLLRSWQVRMPRDEVLSIVGHALCEAACRFDVNKGTSFATFFHYHLRGLLIKEVAKAAKAKEIKRAHHPEDCSSDSPRVLSLAPLLESVTPEDLVLNKELAQLCWRACQSLSDLEREVIIKHYVHDQSIAEIARELGFCRSYISRIKTRARRLIAKRVLGTQPRRKDRLVPVAATG